MAQSIRTLRRRLPTPEQEERQALRAAYIAEIRADLVGTLDNVSLKNPDGSIEPLKRRSKPMS